MQDKTQNPFQYVSLYEFLGTAAGKELGAKIFKKSKELDVFVQSRKISNPKYKGTVALYPRYFLERYFQNETQQPKKHVVVSLSGGMDSSTLLLRCLKEYDTVTAISFDYGQKHRVELERAQSFCLLHAISTALRPRCHHLVHGESSLTDQDLDYPFPSYIARALRKDDPFDIWGDGYQVRDFIHMQDVVDAVDKAIELDIPGPVNLGSGQATSFRELAKLVCKLQGYSPEYNFIETAPVGVTYRVADPTKMLSFYKPKISLTQGIVKALEGNI